MNAYTQFKSLHLQELPFILANAWNVRSAQLIEQAGFPAIGTSSGAIAETLGYKDGEQISFDEVHYIIKRIKSNTSLPLTVDMERGYSDNVQQVTDNVQRLIDTGVSGINIEDSQGEAIYLKKLYAIKNHLEKTHQQLFINARTDGFLQKVEAPVETTIGRAKKYKEAGADGIFVTGVSNISTIQSLSAGIELPLNVVGSPNLASGNALSNAGVKRISMAVFLYKAAYHPLSTMLKDIFEEQSLQLLYKSTAQ